MLLLYHSLLLLLLLLLLCVSAVNIVYRDVDVYVTKTAALIHFIICTQLLIIELLIVFGNNVYIYRLVPYIIYIFSLNYGWRDCTNWLLAYFPHFEKNKRGLWDHLAACVSLSVCAWRLPPINFRKPKRIFMKLGMYIMAPEPISVAYLINPSHQSVCLCVYCSISLLSNGSVNTFPAATKTRNNRKLIGRVVLCAVRVESKENLWVYLCIPVDRERLGKYFRAATKNFWGLRFLCFPCCIKGK
jgi:hypothetical protein